MRGRRANLIVVGSPASLVTEGGGSRMAQLRVRLESLSAPVRYLDPAVASSGRAFVRHAMRSGLGGALLDPRRRHALVSLGPVVSPRVLALLRPHCALAYFDVHDEPRRQFRDLQIAILGNEELETRGRLLDACTNAFECVGFATPGLAGFFPRRPGHLIAPNAADPDHFSPGPVPEAPTVALVGSTARGRGAEDLIRACEMARGEVPDLILRLALQNTGGRGDLDELKRRYGGIDWISFEEVGYADLPEFLRGARVCAVPHPRSEYTDIALPLKLFDYMASARPVVTTDCPAAADVVRRNDAGLVCRSDPVDMASAIIRLLSDHALASAQGRNGRRAIETVHNWDRSFEEPLLAIRRRLDGTGRRR